ncbi:hypothetical protein Pcinc_035134 [Petrolisthes cinctipes]|uniref:Glycolipid transfer protein domain-containing protein n=1 Tax=Petrolisthes cinctipes TaxID=88211 RepID=A0AAE1BXE6_PETCI|nr:hypothetical protein Pcinc_035134 [Petrolisthes cinctipes]
MSNDTSNDPVVINFFTLITPNYPTVTPEGLIDTLQFIEASKAFIKIYDLLGTAFYVVKKDMSGNIEKLYKVYNKNPEKYKYLNDLILGERGDPTKFAIDALLWLKRALEFTVIFINGICEEYKTGLVNNVNNPDRIDHLATEAYNKTLRSYHSWIVQNLFKISPAD